MADSPIQLVVATPCYGGQVTAFYANSLLRLKDACHQMGNINLQVNMMYGDALIPRARQDLVAQFLEMDSATHLLFIDADIGFDPDQVFRLLQFNADVSAGVYPAKVIDWNRVIAQAKAGIQRIESASLAYVVGAENPEKIEVKGVFAKVRYAGTGFMLIKRSVLLAMIEKYPQLKYSGQFSAQEVGKKRNFLYALFNCILDEQAGVYLSEDFSFCRRWTDVGGEIWVDLQSRLSHVGPMVFQGDLSTQFPDLPSKT
jgi:hypothetical protein